MNNIKSINGLMKYLREKHNMSIEGSYDKKRLKNIGYYHGYKGYRYIKKPTNRVEFSEFDELVAVIEFDNKVKSLLYPQVMFIETAIKSYALEIIIKEGKSENFSDVYSNLMTDYKSYNGIKYKDAYKKRLDTFNRIQNTIAIKYAADNNIVSHYLKKDESIPIWAILEIITLGEFGNLISTLELNVRRDISRDLGLNVAFDSAGILVQSIIFSLKDLRNAIAHNDVVYDTRFRKMDPSRPMKQCLILEMGLPYINFKTIGDYIILVCYCLKLLKVTKTEIKLFVREFEKITKEYEKMVNAEVTSVTIHSDLNLRMEILKKTI